MSDLFKGILGCSPANDGDNRGVPEIFSDMKMDYDDFMIGCEEFINKEKEIER